MDTVVEKRKSFIINFLYFAIFVGLYYFVMKYALAYIFPFVVAIALAMLLQRPVKAITKKLHLKAHGAVSIILVLLIVVVIVGTLAVASVAIFNEIKDFVTYLFSLFSSFGEFLDTAEEFVVGLTAKLPGGLAKTVGSYVTEFFDKIGTKSDGLDLSVLSAPLSGAWSVVKGLPSFLLSILVTIISCVFVTADYENIKNLVLGMCEKKNAEKLTNCKRTVTKGVGKLFKAYATIMLITFSEMFIGLSFMKLIGVYTGGYIAVISLVTCVVDIVPVLGTGTVVIPWAIYCLVMGDIGVGVGLIILYAVITVLRQIIEPKLVANQVGLPAIVTIMAMFIGARAFGVFGIIILPLTVIILKLMIDEGIIGKKSREAELSMGDEVSVIAENTVAEDNIEKDGK